MFLKAFAAFLPFVLQATASPHHRQSVFKTDEDCPKGVHIIGVRGTLEKPGFGALQDVVDHVVQRIPGSTSVAIDYPAGGITIVDGEPRYNFPEYVASVMEGVSKFKTEIQTFGDRCPDTGIVIMGYSQGAHVLGTGICGGGSLIFPPSIPIDYDYTYQLSAIIQLGDPTNVRGLPWHVGNATNGGIFPRQNFAACGRLGDNWQSYCDDKDLFCDRGDSIPVHLGYVERYRDDIVDFIVGKNEESQSKSRVFEYRGATDLLLDLSCRVTGIHDGCEQAHLIPVTARDWWDRNMAGPSTFETESARNGLPLRMDLHCLFDISAWVPMVKDSKMLVDVLRISDLSNQFVPLFHNHEMQEIIGFSKMCLFARIVYGVLPLLSDFLSAWRLAKENTLFKIGGELKEWTPDACKSFKPKVRSRNPSLKKRHPLQQIEEDGLVVAALWHDADENDADENDEDKDEYFSSTTNDGGSPRSRKRRQSSSMHHSSLQKRMPRVSALGVENDHQRSIPLVDYPSTVSF